MFNYNNMDQYKKTIHYRSPDSGENFNLGEWKIIEVNPYNAIPGLFSALHFIGDIIDWGTCPDMLSFYYGIFNMSSEEFTALNTSSQLDICYARENRTSDRIGGFGCGINLFDDTGTRIAVFKVIASENSSDTGALRGLVEIYQYPF